MYYKDGVLDVVVLHLKYQLHPEQFYFSAAITLSLNLYLFVFGDIIRFLLFDSSIPWCCRICCPDPPCFNSGQTRQVMRQVLISLNPDVP